MSLSRCTLFFQTTVLLVGCLVLTITTASGQSPTDGDAPARGGAAGADFDALIELITATVAPDTWAENGGGEAEIRPFPTGVWIDPAGVIESKIVETSQRKRTGSVSARRPAEAALSNPRRSARLRCVSLPRLEAEVLRRGRAGEPLDQSMLTLAGLRRVERVIIVPPTIRDELGDLILAGPAGDWRVDGASRLVAVDSGEAVVRLDDVLTLLRREQSQRGKPLGCAITPRQAALAATQAKLNETSGTSIRPRQRDAWLEGVRSTLGRQDIEVWGLDPSSNAARVLVEADHHMKQLGLGVAERVEGAPSYLDRAVRAIKRGEDPKSLSVLRWWFASNYESVERSADGTAYRLNGVGVRVLSENELLTLRGERVHTGKSDAATEGFAQDFTDHFAEIAEAYPVYGELRNVFDLAIVAALIRSEGMLASAAWRPELFLDPSKLPTPRLRVPREVETMATCRVVNKRTILAAVSGGVWLEPGNVAVERRRVPTPKKLAPANGDSWWWD